MGVALAAYWRCTLILRLVLSLPTALLVRLMALAWPRMGK
jgi:hypothetical protein